MSEKYDPKDFFAAEDPQHDPVNHPAHYTAGGVECIDAIRAALTCQTDPYAAWLTGQVIKYLWRWVDLGEDGGRLTACVYILKTGKRRGCPAGEGCTKYKKRTRRAFTEGWFEGR